jgi:hypothetical protein
MKLMKIVHMTSKVSFEAHPIQQGQDCECAVLQVIYAVMVRCSEMVENVILHDAAIVHLAATVKNFLEVGGGGKFYSTLPILLTSVHHSLI